MDREAGTPPHLIVWVMNPAGTVLTLKRYTIIDDSYFRETAGLAVQGLNEWAVNEYMAPETSGRESEEEIWPDTVDSPGGGSSRVYLGFNALNLLVIENEGYIETGFRFGYARYYSNGLCSGVEAEFNSIVITAIMIAILAEAADDDEEDEDIEENQGDFRDPTYSGVFSAYLGFYPDRNLFLCAGLSAVAARTYSETDRFYGGIGAYVQGRYKSFDIRFDYFFLDTSSGEQTGGWRISLGFSFKHPDMRTGY
jgi:hypothetical protein